MTDHLVHREPTLRTDALVYHLADDSRIVARPSGTEPKVKLYGEVITECGPDAAASFAAAEGELAALLAAATTDLGLRHSGPG